MEQTAISPGNLQNGSCSHQPRLPPAQVQVPTEQARYHFCCSGAFCSFSILPISWLPLSGPFSLTHALCRVHIVWVPRNLDFLCLTSLDLLSLLRGHKVTKKQSLWLFLILLSDWIIGLEEG